MLYCCKIKFMALRKVFSQSSLSDEEVVSIGKSGFYFSSAFVKKNELLETTSCFYYFDDDNFYRIGFEFLETKEPYSISMISEGSSKSFKGNEIFNSRPYLKEIASLDDKRFRRFTPKKSTENSKVWVVDFAPSFELKTPYDEVNGLDNDLSGIYRYKDVDGKVIYIGKGNIKSRAKSDGREEWGIKIVEYSIIENEEEQFKWEAYQLDMYLAKHGRKPAFNRIMGHSK